MRHGQIESVRKSHYVCVGMQVDNVCVASTFVFFFFPYKIHKIHRLPSIDRLCHKNIFSLHSFSLTLVCLWFFHSSNTLCLVFVLSLPHNNRSNGCWIASNTIMKWEHQMRDVIVPQRVWVREERRRGAGIPNNTHVYIVSDRISLIWFKYLR